jgi:hypothetical protein
MMAFYGPQRFTKELSVTVEFHLTIEIVSDIV